ncbi:MAG: hypothetical protein EZS28_037430, partial [Streblomastix strix]
VRFHLQPMLADIEDHRHSSKVRIPRITVVPELRVVAAAPNNQGKPLGLTIQLLYTIYYYHLLKLQTNMNNPPHPHTKINYIHQRHGFALICS